MIELDKITKYFGPVLAVDKVSFNVERGEVVGFLGLNGAGKTTTIRILTTYLPATSGVARVAGYDVMTQSLEVRRNIGYLPESVPLYPEMRVQEYILFRAKLKGVPRKQRTSRVEYCLERCQLKEVRGRLLGTLSKGYRQRVGLADAMVNDPPILILDEPTAGMDPKQIRVTLSLIRELGDKHTVLFSHHILTEVEEVCERVIIINSGRIQLTQYLHELEQQAMILVEIRGPTEQAANTLRGLIGVNRVDTLATEDGVSRFEVHTQDNTDLREKISEAMANKHWTLRRLERKRRRLEDAFFDVVRAENPLKEDANKEAVAAGPPT